jgi:predicted DNA-binding protein with PD1-like motif
MMIKVEHEQDVMVRLVDGEELISSLATLSLDSAVLLNGVGMLRDLELGYWNGSSYDVQRITEPVELLSLQGNFARKGDERIIHCHTTIAKRGAAAFGGHVLKATVNNTAEIYIRKLSGIVLERKMEETGLAGLYPR